MLTILISNKKDIKSGTVTRGKEEHYILIKGQYSKQMSQV